MADTTAPSIKRLHLIMGLQCNARCVMCYQNDFSSKSNMPAEIYLEHLKDLYPRVDTVKMQGGEPTVMKNCKELAQHLRQYPDIRLSIVTNGIALSEFWSETFSQQAGNINFSVNAATSESYDGIVKRGNFEKVLKNIATVTGRRENGKVRLTMSLVVLPRNVMELADFLALAADLGVDGVAFISDPILSFAELPAQDRLFPMLDRAYEQAEKTGLPAEGLSTFARKAGYPGSHQETHTPREVCPMPFNNLVVDEKGDVRVCCDTWRVMGNTYEKDIEEIIADAPSRRFREKVSRGDYSWCEPCCPDNPHPSRSAIIGKYAYMARRHPLQFAGKVAAKVGTKRRMEKS